MTQGLIDNAAEEPAPARALPAALSISGLRFRYGGEGGGVAPERAWSLRVDDLVVEAGEQVLLTAPSGRGKSTLLHLIAGLMEPDGGEVRVAGRNVHALRGHARDVFRGRTIGMIFQSLNLLRGFSAAENVAAALLFAGDERARTPARRLARAGELLRALGIDRPGAPPERLSVGQQQRVAIARALVCGPALVLADEPTASLDPVHAAAAMDLIQSSCRSVGAALLCVSHDPAMAARFARRAELDALARAA